MVCVPATPSEHTDAGGLRAKKLTQYDRLSARAGAEWCVLAERNMRAHFIVVSAVMCQQFAKVPFPEYHDMVEAVASDRSNQPFLVTVLPWGAGCDWSVSDAHGSQSTCHRDTTRSVAVTNDVAWRLIPRECFQRMVPVPRRRTALPMCRRRAGGAGGGVT